VAELLGRLEVDDQVELRGPLHGEVGRISTLKDFINVSGSAPEIIGGVRSIGHETTDGARKLRILTREDVPNLKNKRSWNSFPVEDYDVLILDSLGSFTESHFVTRRDTQGLIPLRFGVGTGLALILTT